MAEKLVPLQLEKFSTDLGICKESPRLVVKTKDAYFRINWVCDHIDVTTTGQYPGHDIEDLLTDFIYFAELLHTKRLNDKTI